MTKITLDAETFKALASATRLTVLKALDERRKTLTELSRDMDLNKATVHEHLQLLTAAGLIRKRDDEGRKWIYYELTWTGERILHPQETTTFNVLLGLGFLAAGGGVTFLGRALGWWLEEHQANQATDARDQSLAGAPEQASSDTPPSSGQPHSSGTATGTQTSAPSTTAPAGQSADSAFGIGDSAEKVAVPAQDDGVDFFDDGGWLALALILSAILFVILGGLIRRKLAPEPFDAAAAARAESKSPP